MLNTQREISYLRAPMCYSLFNLHSCIKLGISDILPLLCCFSFTGTTTMLKCFNKLFCGGIGVGTNIPLQIDSINQVSVPNRWSLFTDCHTLILRILWYFKTIPCTGYKKELVRFIFTRTVVIG